MPEELRDAQHAAGEDRAAQFAIGPQALRDEDVGEVGSEVGFPGQGHAEGEADDGADAGEEAGGEDGGDGPFLAGAHFELEDGEDGQGEEDDVGDGVDGGGDDQEGHRVDAFPGE